MLPWSVFKAKFFSINSVGKISLASLKTYIFRNYSEKTDIVVYVPISAHQYNSYRKQSINLHSKSNGWFLHEMQYRGKLSQEACLEGFLLMLNWVIRKIFTIN